MPRRIVTLPLPVIVWARKSVSAVASMLIAVPPAASSTPLSAAFMDT